MIQIGYTALFIVPNSEMAQLLLDKGADINIRDHVSLHEWYIIRVCDEAFWRPIVVNS